MSSPIPQNASEYTTYVVYFSLLSATILFLTCIKDVVSWLWVWSGLGNVQDEDGDEMIEIEDTIAERFTVGIHNGIEKTTQTRLTTLETQLHDLQRRLSILESHNNIQIPNAPPLPIPIANGGVPPPPPPPPPVMNLGASSLNLSTKITKRTPIEEDKNGQISMQDVLQELFTIKRQVNIMSSPRKSYLSKRFAPTKHLPSPLRPKTPRFRPSTLTSGTVPPRPTGYVPAQSKALQTLKALQKQMDVAYGKSPEKKAAEERAKDSEGEGILDRESVIGFLKVDDANGNENENGAKNVDVNDEIVPVIANAAEMDVMRREEKLVEDKDVGVTTDADTAVEAPIVPKVVGDGTGFMDGNKENRSTTIKSFQLPGAPTHHDSNGTSHKPGFPDSVNMFPPTTETLSQIQSRLRKTNVARSPGGTTFIPRRTSLNTKGGDKGELAKLKEKFKGVYGKEEDEGMSLGGDE